VEDGSNLRRIANAADCGYIEKRRKPYVAHMSGAGSAAMIYLQNNVFDEALERLRMIFDGHDDVIVSMSGGKDSTVLFRMALMVAQERGRLPLKVFWLDQEAEWQATVDYMQHIMELPEVTPYWYQIPFEFTNTLSPEKNFISVWNPEDKAIWIHPQHPLSIKENPSSENRFHELVNVLPSYCTDSEKGHARYAAAIRLGMEEIPCVVTDADEETIKLDRLADNRISEFSEWINDELLHEIDMLNLDFDFDLESLGFPAPSDDFDADALFDDGVVGESEEDRRARYQAYLDNAAKEEAQNVAITTQEQVDRAKASALSVAEKPPKYAKVVCEHCGHVMFIKEGDAVFSVEQS
jgi:hypothetical protein